MKDYRTMSIGEIVTIIPKAMGYFKSKHIDYCCGGYRILGDVIKEHHLNIEEINTNLNHLESTMTITKSYDQMSVNELCDYIVDHHHTYLRKVIPEIDQYLSAVMRAHGANHLELFTLAKIFGQLSTDLKQHLIKEEEILFTLLKESEKNNVKVFANDIIHEHVEVGMLLEKMRHLTNDYTLPADACDTYEKLYSSLSKMEDDLHTHIHLENNILLKQFDTRT